MRAQIVLPVLAILALAGCNGNGAGTPLAQNSPQQAVTASSGTETSPPSAKPTPKAARKTAVMRPAVPTYVILPRARLTPGATNPRVTQSTIHSTICVAGYSSSIRPSSSYTTSLKRQQLYSGYNRSGDVSLRDYEEDHLISLELGGSPTSVANLWPEYLAGIGGAHTKDKTENRLHQLVCAGRLGLAAAQRAIATNWWAAYVRYGGTTASVTDTYPVPSPVSAKVISTGCTRTSTGSCIRAGEYCPNADEGHTGTDATGETLLCQDKHWHHV